MLLLSAMVVGLFARTWVILHAPGHAFAVDQLFDRLAWNLATLHQFTADGVNPAAHVGPLYPLVLAGFYTFVGHRPEWVPMLHVLFDLGTAWCMYRVATALWGSWIGAWTAALVFLYPAYWTYDPRIRSEALLTLLMSVWLWATVVCRQSPSSRRCAFVGLAAGVTILCKPVVLALALLLTGLLWIDRDRLSRKIGYVIVYGATCATLIIPWSLRNYVVFHDIVPVSAGIGAGLWMGSDPISRGSWPMPPEREQAIWESAGITPLPYAHAMYDVQTDQLLREKGLSRIAADPIGYVGLTFTRVWDFWIGNSFYLVNGEGLTRGLQKDAEERGWTVAAYSLLKRLLVVPGFLVVAICSTWVHRKRWRELLPLYLFPVGLTASYVPFTVEAGRYALPVLPCLMMLSVALVPHWQTLRSSFAQRHTSPQARAV
ncbi:MAG: glycosyltransferase family 39 protein [Nitrospira sp.]|nr:glycosyltransferase family 39 protein [Nitrospira sp.]